ncbi:MAG: alpha-glucan family phosphorylase [Proteobacteria bacterium]|nr:alpha-glucan family phosphorylase [Pseudomonadota bacterium]
MQALRVFSVVPKLPPKLEPLWDIATNLWFSWNNDLTNIFTTIDHNLWVTCQQNPVLLLNRLPQRRIEELARDDFFIQRLADAKRSLDHYLARKHSAFKFPAGREDSPCVAYFSLEYGIAMCLPIYSGGLGILAGDHLKSASDLNIPLVGVGLLYREGYFRQYMTPDAWQQERYPDHEFEQMPIRPALGQDGNPCVICVDCQGQPLHARVWEVHVGKVRLYLLDSNVPENPPFLRAVTSRLYGGGLEMRLQQEILLGIGGIRALACLGVKPMVIHMNEGHSAFAGLERIRVYMQDHGLSFEAASELTASSSVFTTHTPVPAGNDRFPPELMHAYFEEYARKLNLAFKVFLALGREDPRDEGEQFCMTVLALRLSRFSNGVSKLHGEVSRNMWQKVWPQNPVEDVPIGAITNGVHTPTWVATDMAILYDRYLGNWREDSDCVRVWNQAEGIPDAELWRTHERLRERLVDFVRKRLRKQLMDKGARHKELQQADEVLDPQALTIGFARRFATYKRANLLLLDKERLVRLLTNTERRVQFIFAGKAHPNDNEGKKIIQDLVQLCRREDCRLSMVFLEDYDMKIASRMVQGCDVWLNNPRRPLEACGTSGMKALANGVLQLSTLDGWWDEAYRPDNSLGWAIGRGEEYEDSVYQDFVESQTLFNIMENDVLTEFYDRGHGNLPRTWIRKMKSALRELGPIYNAHRMVEDYTEKAYLPSCRNYQSLVRDEFGAAKDLAQWRMKLMTSWNKLSIRNISTETHEKVFVEEPVLVEAEVQLDGLTTRDVQVEIYYGPVAQDSAFTMRKTSVMTPEKDLGGGWHLYRGEVLPAEAGRFGFTVRILPHHPLLLDSHALGLLHWATES